jgi:hypothetical protein
MRRRISHSRGRLAPDQDGHSAHEDYIGRPDAGEHVANAGGGQAADQDRRATGRKHGSADVGDDPRHHRTGVHVAYSCGGLSHLYLINN